MESLIARFAVDATVGIFSAALVAPVMTIIDKGVTEANAGKSTIFQSMQRSAKAASRQPVRFARTIPFLAMLALYGGTYVTANVVDTMSTYSENAPAGASTSSLSKFFAVATVNTVLAVNKDRVFARAFGIVNDRRFTVGSYISFLLRDALTLSAAFNLPQTIATALPESFEAFASRLTIAQLIIPASMQPFATPLHVLGLDIYNRPTSTLKTPFQERMAHIRRVWLSTSGARASRVFVAFGLGNVVNSRTRKKLMDNLEESSDR